MQLTARKFQHIFLLAVAGLMAFGSMGIFAGEKEDRKTDRLGLELQKDVITKLSALVKKHHGRPEEATLLTQLIEAHQAASEFEFRLAHYESNTKGIPVSLAKYEKRLDDVVSTATLLITQFPYGEDLDRIYFARGQAYQELKNIPLAKKDYELIAERYPETTYAIRGNLALASFSTEANDPRSAIVYLKRVEKYPNDTHYPFALYQTAWSYYNLLEIPAGLSYLKRYVEYYQNKMGEDPQIKLSASEQAYYEHGIRDVVTFYYMGLEKKQPDFTVGNALSTFKKYDSSPALGKMLVSFAKHLRTGSLIPELVDWKNIVIQEENSLSESLDVVLVYFDYMILKYGITSASASTSDIVELNKKTKDGINKFASYAAAASTLLKTANTIQLKITETKDRTEAIKLSQILKTVYNTFLTVADKEDPRVAQVHHNHAETLFKLENFEESATEYAWVLEHWTPKIGPTKNEISVKQISARYQTLLAKGELPKTLSPSLYKGEETLDLSKLSKLSNEWVTWVDRHLKEFGRTPVAIENFEHESNRLLYSAGQKRAALERMSKFVNERPNSKFSLAAVSLILDTYMLNQDWELAETASIQFAALNNLGTPEFRAKLSKIPDDTSYKLVEKAYQAKDFPKVLLLSQKYLDTRSNSSQMPACLFLASRAAEKMSDTKKSLFYLNELLTRYPKSDNRGDALLARAAIKETEYDFDAASQDYREYFSQNEKQTGNTQKDLLKRFWFVNWLSQSPKKITCPTDGTLSQECDRYRALVSLSSDTEVPEKETVKKGLNAPNEIRPLWAALALQKRAKVGFKDRLELASVLAKEWKSLDPLIQFTLIPVLNQNLPQAFALSREELSKIAPLEANSKAISRRIKLIQTMETAAGVAVSLPWIHAKASVLNDISGIYLDFSNQLAHLPVPKDYSAEEKAEYTKSVNELVGPFKEKSAQIKKQADELGLGKLTELGATASMDLFEKTGDGSWKKDPLWVLWTQALSRKSWPRLGYFFQEFKDKSHAKEPTLALMRIMTLGLAGAKLEAQTQLAELKSSFPEDRQPAAEKTP